MPPEPDPATPPPAAPPAPAPPPAPPEPPAADDKGFPPNTPVAEMKPAEQAAYWRTQAQKHEGRNKELLGITGGKYGADLKAALDERERLLDSQRTDSEKAVEAAKREAAEAVAREYGPKSVRAAFNLLLGDMPQQDREAEIELLRLEKFLTADGEVDTDKVRQKAASIAPSVKDRRHDYGQGRRGPATAPSGVAAGADRFAAKRNKSTNS